MALSVANSYSEPFSAFILRGSIYVNYRVPQNLTDFLQELHKDVTIFWGASLRNSGFFPSPGVASNISWDDVMLSH